MSSTASTPKEHHVNPWWVAVISGMASYIDSCAIVSSGTALVIYRDQLGLSVGEYGILSGCLTFAIALGAVFGGRLGDHFGRKKVFSVTMCFIIVGALMLIFGHMFPLLLVGMILCGLGTGADLPVSLATIAEEAPDKDRGKMIAFSNLLWVVGIVAAYLVGTVVGDWGFLGGQIMFAHLGLVALLVLLGRATIPESPVWLKARQERLEGKNTTQAQKAGLGDLFHRPYGKPFIALIIFYVGTALPANTLGQFGTLVNVDLVGMTVGASSLLMACMYPVQAIFNLVFMKFVDTPKRMMLFYIGVVLYVLGFLTFPVLGFSVPTVIATQLLYGVGAAFAFEGILKVWTQESFPTLLRTTAQGSIVFVARFSCAVLGMLTPALFSAAPQGTFVLLAACAIVGYAFAVWAFGGNRARNEFKTEDEAPVAAAAQTAK